MRKNAILIVFLLMVQILSPLAVMADSNEEEESAINKTEGEVSVDEEVNKEEVELDESQSIAGEEALEDQSQDPTLEEDVQKEEVPPLEEDAQKEENKSSDGEKSYDLEEGKEPLDEANKESEEQIIEDEASVIQENEKDETEKVETTKQARTFVSQVIEEESTSLLGHLHSGSEIYKTIEGRESFSSDNFLNAVYYIKKQANVNGQKYYLISTEPSSTQGTIGWVMEEDLSTHSHKGVDTKRKDLIVKGTGSAYSKAWGGNKDVVFGDLSVLKGNVFKVNKTETVGNNTWYRGYLNGKEVFIHSSYLTTKEESSTSRLGHVKSGSTIFQTIGETATSFSSDDYLNSVYYIKRQALVEGQLYYLISTEPSSSKGVVGWLRAEDMQTHTHKGVDTKSKTFYVKGTGTAYAKAWGGPNDEVYHDLSGLKGNVLKVNKTETVGKNTWYRGDLNGKEVFIHSSYLTTKEETSTSRLGHIKSGSTIYETIGDTTTSFSSDDYLNAVYYIKRQAQVGDQLYYLISSEPSSSKGVLGWLRAEDMQTHMHKGLDTKSKTFYVKGTGTAYAKAWGGPKDVVYQDLSELKGNVLNVNKTESVGNNTWYRGDLNGEEVFIHSSYLTTKEETSTSRLGHIKSGSTIYETIGDTTTSFSSDDYLNAVYYIKRQAQVGDQLYYLISNEPSSSKGVLGWLKAEDLNTHTHQGVDSKNKSFYVKGTGTAYSKAWGGSKDVVYQDLSKLKGNVLEVNKTEKVGNNVWYRGELDGREVFIHEAYLNQEKKTTYNLSLSEALKMQMSAAPQTDKEYDTYVSSNYIDGSNRVTADVLNVRGGPSTNYWVVGKLKKGEKVTILSSQDGWHKIEFTKSRQWVNPSENDVLYYLNPKNFLNNEKQRLQFVDLAQTIEASENELYRVFNNHLKGRGILDSQAQAFIDAGEMYGINEIYLVAHTILETGNGSSTLAKGVEYKGVKVYNMYGVGALDACPITCGAKRAYEEGWTTPYKAIVGGARFAAQKYILVGQNTLYKIRWNPAAMDTLGYPHHQYASDIGWAYKQVNTMYNLYQQLSSYTLKYDIPEYK